MDGTWDAAFEEVMLQSECGAVVPLLQEHRAGITHPSGEIQEGEEEMLFASFMTDSLLCIIILGALGNVALKCFFGDGWSRDCGEFLKGWWQARKTGGEEANRGA